MQFVVVIIYRSGKQSGPLTRFRYSGTDTGKWKQTVKILVMSSILSKTLTIPMHSVKLLMASPRNTMLYSTLHRFLSSGTKLTVKSPQCSAIFRRTHHARCSSSSAFFAVPLPAPRRFLATQTSAQSSVLAPSEQVSVATMVFFLAGYFHGVFCLFLVSRFLQRKKERKIGYIGWLN